MSCLSKSDYYAVASILTIYATASLLTVFITSCETCGDFILNVDLPLTIDTRQKLNVICFYSLLQTLTLYGC